MNEKLIVRYGDLNLKGKNKKFFIKSANALIKEKLKGLDVSVEYLQDRVYVDTKNEELDTVIERLDRVSGLNSYSIYLRCEHDIEEISKIALETYDKNHKDGESFKVEARRPYKNFPYDSLGIMKYVSAYILKNRENCRVDVHNPDLTIYVEIRPEGSFVLTSSINGMGGYPTGTGGKALLMMSGGIDSPVAAYELMKQGMTVELIHFESTPLTSIESAQKVVDLAKKLALYACGNKINIHFIPFAEVHQEILEKVDDEYIITIMRRCMYKIAQKIANYRKILAIGNGESLGQVASQTIESMYVINNVTNTPILRPLLTMDKRDIIKISRKIDTYDISIRPFEDCCTVYVPKYPVIKPILQKCFEMEEKGDFENLITNAARNSIRYTIYPDSDIDLALNGFTVSEAIENIKAQERGE